MPRTPQRPRRRRRTPAIGWWLSLVIATYMLPPVAPAEPLYMALAALGLLNSVFGLALVYLSILAPFTTWLMKSGFDGIPRKIEQAAMMDGASLFSTLRIVTATVGGQRLVAALPASSAVEAGDALFLHIDSAGLHVFDAETERRIGWVAHLGPVVTTTTGVPW